MLKFDLRYVNRFSEWYQSHVMYAHRCWCEVDLDLFRVGASYKDGDSDPIVGLVKFVAK